MKGSSMRIKKYFVGDYFGWKGEFSVVYRRRASGIACIAQFDDAKTAKAACRDLNRAAK